MKAHTGNGKNILTLGQAHFPEWGKKSRLHTILPSTRRQKTKALSYPTVQFPKKEAEPRRSCLYEPWSPSQDTHFCPVCFTAE